MEPLTLTIAVTATDRISPVCTGPDATSTPVLIDDQQHLPAGVYLNPDGTVATGRQAADLTAADPHRFIANPVELLGGPAVQVDGQPVDPVELVTALIRRCAAEAHATTGRPIDRLQLVVPADWGPRRYTLARTAAAHAGIPDPTLVAAPVAVACYATLTIGIPVPVGGLLAVCDTDTTCAAILTRLDDLDWDILSVINRTAAAHTNGQGPDTTQLQPTAGTSPDTVSELVDILAAAVGAADIDPTSLTAIACAGAPTLPPGLDTAITESFGKRPVLLARPTQAAALGAAHRLTHLQPAPTARWAPIPPVGLGIGHLLALIATGGLSLILMLQTLASAYINRAGLYIDYVLVNRGELALACLLAMLTTLGVGRALTLARVAALAERAAPPPGSRPQRLLAAGAGVGIAMCLIYALTAAIALPLPAGTFLIPTLAAVATPLLCTGWLLVILPRLAHLGGGALQQLGTPIAAIATASAGVILLQHGYTTGLPHLRMLVEIRAGGGLVGIGCVLLFAHTWRGRLIAGGLAGAVGALAFSFGTYQLAAAAYLTCTGIWWITHTATTTRDAFPHLARLRRTTPKHQPAPSRSSSVM